MDLKSNVSDPSSWLGSAIKNRRRELGFSQEELAWRAGLNRTYVTDVERGARNLSLATIDKLARALEIPLSTLLHHVDQARGTIETSHSEPFTHVDILLVEDNPRDVEMTLRALRRARLANFIEVARDGVEALAYLLHQGVSQPETTKDPPRLILLDLRLPRLDGIEVLRRLKAEERTRSIPVVVLTASEESQDIEEARKLGAASYIVKPVDFMGLCKVIPALDFCWALQTGPVRPPAR